jgi:hypothetical protein
LPWPTRHVACHPLESSMSVQCHAPASGAATTWVVAAVVGGTWHFGARGRRAVAARDRACRVGYVPFPAQRAA